ncbi:MAG: U32 family peptidase, partial [Candidatus Cryptobacteroides sp.]|nr:U32 family peptidase [Candidatus Cryptobacteroides sp.]
ALLATGPTTGVVELTVEDMRVDFNPVELTPKGVRCSLAVDTALCPDGRLRRGEKIFVWK